MGEKRDYKELFDENFAKKNIENDEDFTHVNMYDGLDSLDEKLIQLYIAYPGIKKTEVAKALNICRANVVKRCKKQAVRDYINRYRLDAMELLKKVQNESINKLYELMNSDNPRIALEAAKTLSKASITDKVDMTSSGDPIQINITSDFLPKKDENKPE